MLIEKQLRRFRTLLERERAEIEESIAVWRRDIGDPAYGETAGVDDIGDESTRIFEKETEIDNIRRAEARLRQIRHALERMDDGSYGVSEVSGRPIPIERLEAIPWATTLVDEPAPEDANS